MVRLVGELARHPARMSFGWYAAGMVAGTLLLMQPFSRVPGVAPVTAVDAVFTATSAVCVTGLTVRSTGEDYSLVGQLIILALFQLGGIGIITVTTYVTLRLGGRQSLHRRTLLAETLGTGDESDLRSVLRRVVRFALLFELVGAVLLTANFLLFYDHTLPTALWHGVFHAVSAFCNAGFSLNDTSLMDYRGDWLVNVVVMALIISGGIGYPVMIDVTRNWYGPWPDRWSRLMLHTKLMVVGTVVLVTLGTAAVLVLEWERLLSDLPWPQRVMAAMFQSVTARTAGFNTLDTAALSEATLFIVMLLMMVGGGPCSAAGGFKVSTLAVLVLRGWTALRGGTRVLVARRMIPEEVTDRAITTALMFAVVSIAGLTFLLAFEHIRPTPAVPEGIFLNGCFEVASALGTVGLSTRITPDLTTAGKVVIIVLMFVGRLGPITVVAAVALSRREPPIAYAREEPLVG